MSRKPEEKMLPAIRYDAEILGSVALRALPAPATKIMHVFETQVVNGHFNSKLRVPHSLILEWMNSTNKGAISLPVRQLHAFGFIRPGPGPGLVRLTYFPVGITPPTNEWREIMTFEQAEMILEGLKTKRRPQTDEYQSRIHTGEWPKRR
jgi:hypothetical protein